MLRYDPTKTDHTKFVQNKRKLPTEELSNKKNKRAKQQHETKEQNATEATVSKDQFYKVSSNLTSSLQRDAGDFSLLTMFGRADAQPVEQSTKAYKETLLATKAQKSIADMTNPFSYESDGEEVEIDGGVVKAVPTTTPKVDAKNGKKNAVWHESFFIFSRDDARLIGLFNNYSCFLFFINVIFSPQKD